MRLLRDVVFDSPLERRFFRWYRRVFSIKEIETTTSLQWVFGATIFSYFIAFNSWFGNHATTIDSFVVNQHSCWPYFQSCGEWLFLRTLPQGYSQPFLYMVLFGTLILSIYLMYKKDWVLAHVALLPAFIWHALVTFVITASLSGNYEYYLFILATVLLFAAHKEFFLKLMLVLFYFLAGSIKIHEGWVLGTYLSSLQIGIPLFPEWSTPIWTNLVIFMEIVGAWFLFSRRAVLQRSVLFFFVLFHLYSGLLVAYRYPATVLPGVLILFGMFYAHTRTPIDRRAWFGWLLVVLMFAAQSVAVFIPGDVKLTLEGNKYGLYMFEANHQCISTESFIEVNGDVEERVRTSEIARSRCDPYRYWFALKQRCKVYAETNTRIAWTFDHSVNGGPFLRIVEEEDVCSLHYSAFTHNKWIKTQYDDPEIVGYPVENIYR